MAVENSIDEEDLNEEDDASEEEDGQEGGLDKKKLLLFVVLPLLVLCGLGAGLYFTGTLDKLMGGDEVAMEEHADGEQKKSAKKKSSKKKSGDKHGSSLEGVAGAYFVEIPDMIVNLSGTEDQPRYLRLSIHVELETEEDKMAVETVMPRVVDQFQTYLRELRVQDLKGSTGLYRLRIELLARLNAAAYPVEVQDVLFQEILIQ
jgi:flagellar FliL protein